MKCPFWILLLLAVLAVESSCAEDLVIEEDFPKPIQMELQMHLMCTMKKVTFCLHGYYYRMMDYTYGRRTKEERLGYIPYGCFTGQHTSHKISLELSDIEHSLNFYETSMILLHNCSTDSTWREYEVILPPTRSTDRDVKYEFEVMPENEGTIVAQAKLFDYVNEKED